MTRTFQRLRSIRFAFAALVVIPVLGACSSDEVRRGTESNIGSGSLSSKSTVRPEGQRRVFTRQGAGEKLRVNGFLWRAALDSVAFMPLASADPYGGVIITDWYAPPESPNERFKLTVQVSGAELRSSGVKVSVFKQQRKEKGDWASAEVAKNTAIDLENVILARARDLREQAAAR